jgi:2-polyprenyl-3-methyl-5-hydroxy-6-metoxy-1,4-benzoquinol methylase
MDGVQRHWEAIWQGGSPDELSWYEPRPFRSLELITSVATSNAVPIIDVGGGASTLVDELLARGFADLTVLDISEAALAIPKERIGDDAAQVSWIVDDVRTHHFEKPFAVWHDRAVFHFLVDPDDRRRYVDQLSGSVVDGGHVVLATFGSAGPPTCSGLPVVRYGASEMERAFAPGFELRSYIEEMHTTPAGTNQQFAYALFTRR